MGKCWAAILGQFQNLEQIWIILSIAHSENNALNKTSGIKVLYVMGSFMSFKRLQKY